MFFKKTYLNYNQLQVAQDKQFSERREINSEVHLTWRLLQYHI